MIYILVHINDLLAFVIELLSLFLWGRWAYGIFNKNVLRIPMAIFVVLAFAIIWGLFFSPKATYKLPEFLYYVLKFLILALPFLQFLKSNGIFALIGIVVVGVNTILQWSLGRGDWGGLF